MQRIGIFLSKSHPFNFKGASAIASGLIISLLLFLLQPFGFSDLIFFPRLWKSIVLGGVTTACLILTYSITSGFIEKKQWTIGKDLLFSLFNILIIGFFNAVVIHLLDLADAPFNVLVPIVMKNTLYIGVVASLLLLFYEQSTFLKVELEQLQRINDGLQTRIGGQASDDIITFYSETGQPAFRIQKDEIIYLKSEGNYVDIFCTNQRKELLRNRIKDVYQSLPEHDFFQSHRSYIVNSTKVMKIKKGSRNHELRLSGTDQSIPVSRAKTQELLDYFGSN